MLRGRVAGVVALAGIAGPAGPLAGCGGPSAGAGRDAEIVDATPDAPAPIDVPAGTPDLQFVARAMVNTVAVDQGVVFRDADCEVVEGCVGAAGSRTLLRFATVSANLGSADLFVGVPPPAGESNARFVWSPCHKHHHVRDYASYELVDATGVVATARKQAFCLEDDLPVQPGVQPTGYSCLRQGISRGWADVYTRDLPCQWIDVTDVPPGSYTLRLVINPLHTLPESDYDNNVFTVDVAR